MSHEYGHIDEGDKIPPPPMHVRIIRGVVAAVAIGAILYIFGIHQLLVLHRTPESFEQRPLAAIVEAEELTVPVTVYILTGPAGSVKEVEDARRIVQNASNIWAQARVSFVVRDVRHVPVELRDLSLFEDDPYAFLDERHEVTPGTISVYLTRTLQGVNGLAYGGRNTVSVADYTSTLDYRTLAHEFGHVLWLEHVQAGTRLMSSGGAGLELTRGEIDDSRTYAQREFANEF